MYEVSYEKGILWQKVQVAYYIYAAGGRRLQTREENIQLLKYKVLSILLLQHTVKCL